MPPTMGAILTDVSYQILPPLLLIIGLGLVAIRAIARRHGRAAVQARLQGLRRPARTAFRPMGHVEAPPADYTSDTAGDEEDPAGLLPTIFRTPGGSVAVDIPMRGVNSIKDLVDAVVEAGVMQVDSDISADSIKVHYTTTARPDGKPVRITRMTRWADVQRMASALIVNPL